MSENITQDKNVYIFTQDLTIPPSNGGQTRMFAAMKLLSCYCQVHLIVFGNAFDAGLNAFKGRYISDLTFIKNKSQFTVDASSVPIWNILSMLMSFGPSQMSYLDRDSLSQGLKPIGLPRNPVIWCDSLWLANMLLLELCGNCRLITDMDDVVSAVIAQRLEHKRNSVGLARFLLQWFNYQKVRQLEKKVATMSRVLLSASENHAESLSGLYGSQVVCFPNGVAKLYDNVPDEDVTSKRILLPGSFNYRPNLDAVVWFVTDIWPAIKKDDSDIRLIVAGRNPSSQVKNVCFEAGVELIDTPADMTPIFIKSNLVVAPIRFGSGTRIKILEALNHGRAVVSTVLGADGLHLKDGEDLFLADDPDDFAQKCCELLSAPSARRASAVSGWRKVQKEYLWDTMGGTIRSILDLVEA